MQRFVRAFALAAVVGLLAASGVLAAPGPQLNYGAQLNSSQCGSGKPVINVVEKVLNDADSGGAGNVWAFDSYTRQIQVWQTGFDSTTNLNVYCATVQYEGSFTTVAGDSPGSDPNSIPPYFGSVAPDITGTMHGGYTATFEGTLSSSPEFSTHGNIGTFDYQCDPNGNCPGYVDWVGMYFPGYSNFAQPWWGWIYRTPHNGTWVNASSGNSGDITG